MRQWIKLLEDVGTERSFYLHATSSKNLASIQTRGLVPNHNGGNYQDMRWESLNGVYASRYAKQLADYLNAHLIVDYLLIVIEVDLQNTLPDEDTIDIIFDHLLEKMLQEAGMTLRSPEIEDLYTGEPEFESFVDRLAAGFRELAGSSSNADSTLAREAAQIWLGMKLGVDDEGEFVWGEIKDKLVHQYREMQHPVLNRHSVRIPHVVGFEGPTRIVAIVRVNDDENPKIIYDKVPEEAREEINELVDKVVLA
jgi:hypothetical protein